MQETGSNLIPSIVDMESDQIFSAPTTSTHYWYNCWDDLARQITDRINDLKDEEKSVEVESTT